MRKLIFLFLILIFACQRMPIKQTNRATGTDFTYPVRANGGLAITAPLSLGGVTITTTGAQLNFLNTLTSNVQTQLAARLAISDTATMLAHYALLSETGTGDLNASDTATMLSHYIERKDTSSMLSHYIERKDTATMLSKYPRKLNAALTGIPTAPTAAAGTNTTQLATTAFATTADDLKLNKVDSSATLGKKYVTGKMLNDALALKLNISNPTATGTLTTPILRVGNAASNTITSLDSISKATGATDISFYDGPDTLNPYIPFSKRVNLESIINQFPSYVIEQVGDSVFATPAMRSGYTAYADTNLTIVIHLAMHQLTSGGLIQVKRGFYDHLSSIEIPNDGITIQGEGMFNTKWKLKGHSESNPNGAPYTRDGYLIDTKAVDNFTLRDIELDGNAVDQNFIDTKNETMIANSIGLMAGYDDGVNGSDNLLVENCYIHDFTQSGLAWSGSHALIQGCYFIDCGTAGAEFWPNSIYGVINNCYHQSTSTSLYGGYHLVQNSVWVIPSKPHSWSATDYAISSEGAAAPGNYYNTISNCDISGAGLDYGIVLYNGSRHCKIDGVTIHDMATTNGVPISTIDDIKTTINNVTIYNVSATSVHAMDFVRSHQLTVQNCNIFKLGYAHTGHGIYLDDSDSCRIVNNYIDVLWYCVYIYNSTCTHTVVANNILLNDIGSTEIVNNGTGSMIKNNIAQGTHRALPDYGILPIGVTATADGLTTGLMLSGSQTITVTSANANYIACLPTTDASTIGQVIKSQVDANGFELRVIAAQAASVYINNVTTNVEAAIPANSVFEIMCIDATHWLLKCWNATGDIVVIIPDAV